MPDRSPSNEPEREVLPETVATRLLARAIELDEVNKRGSSVADLRSAAADVGVSTSAFNQALAEMDRGGPPPAPVKASRIPRRLWLALTAFVVALGAAVVVSRLFPSGPMLNATPMVEEAILLRCLSPNDAADLIRPLLDRPANSMVIRSGSRVLTVRASAEQLQKAKALIDQQEAVGTCATPPTPPTPPAKP